MGEKIVYRIQMKNASEECNELCKRIGFFPPKKLSEKNILFFLNLGIHFQSIISN